MVDQRDSTGNGPLELDTSGQTYSVFMTCTATCLSGFRTVGQKIIQRRQLMGRRLTATAVSEQCEVAPGIRRLKTYALLHALGWTTAAGAKTFSDSVWPGRFHRGRGRLSQDNEVTAWRSSAQCPPRSGVLQESGRSIRP